MYLIEHHRLTGQAIIRRTADGALIPRDPKNQDYVEFLAWNAKQDPPLDTRNRVIEQPAPVKPDADLAAIIEKALPGLTRLWILKLTKDNPDITQDFLRQLGYLDTVREGKV